MANLRGKGMPKEKGKSATRVIGQSGGVTLRARKTKTGESLYLDFMQSGQRTTEFLGLYLTKGKNPMEKEQNAEILLQAENVRAQRSIDLQSSRHHFIPQYKLKTDFVEWMRVQTEKRNNSPTWVSALNKLKKFTDHRVIRFNEITEDWLEDLKEFLIGEMKSINSAAKYYADIVTAIRAAKKAKMIKICPTDDVDRIIMQRPLVAFHTPDEVKKMFETPCKTPLIRKAYLFSCLTGLRCIDLFSIIREKFESVSLPDGSTEYRIKLIQQKVTDALYLTISKEAWDIADIDQIIDPKEKVFPLYSCQWLRKELRKWVQDEVKINKHVGWHTARHTNAVIMLINGIDLYTISKRLGHKDITTTQRYLHIVDSQMNKAANIKLFSESVEFKKPKIKKHPLPIVA